MNVLYETRVLNPNGEERVYVGIHSLLRGPLWSKCNTDGYIGSSGVFCQSLKKAGYVKYLKPGWKVLSVTLLKDNATLLEEKELILSYQDTYGVAPEIKHLVGRQVKEGICLNVSAGSTNLLRKDIRTKVAKGRSTYYRTDEGREDCRRRSRLYTSEMRSEAMKRNKEHLDKFVEAGHSKEAREKRHKTYVESGNAKRVSDLGNAVLMARGRKCVLNDGFVGICSEIASHTGLKKGSVGAKISEAFKKGIATCLGWTFKPYYNE